MAQKMQQKFVAIVMFSYIILMTIVLGGINFFSTMQTYQKYDQMLEVLLSNDGEFPEPEEENRKIYIDLGNDFHVTLESEYENRYFLVYMDKNGAYQRSELSHVAAVTEEDAQSYAKKVFRRLRENESRKGIYNFYRYRIQREKNEYTLAFVDISQALINMQNIRITSISIGLLLMCILFAIVRRLAARAMYPLVENMEKQKQFITNAGHELKTPLAIISANADVLELTCGENEWIDSIRNQTKQLNELIKRLLFLSKMEEGQQLVMTDFNLSQVVTEKTKQISAIALSKGKEFETDIQPDISYKGDIDAIEHLASVLTENAVKYCSEEGKITVKLFKTGKIIHFEVRNTGQALDEIEKDKLFERFYRPDSSRNRQTGGHGIGLSIAKAVVDTHKGKIYVKNEPGEIVFCVEL